MVRRLFWERPQLRTEGELGHERRVTWLELFFDLFFVVAVAQFAHVLADNISWLGFWQFVFLFLHLWWVWMGATYYTERFETEGFDQRFFTFLLMIPIAGMAVTAHYAFSKTSAEFALSYAFCRMIITYLWWRGGRYDRRFRPTARRYVLGFSVSIVLFVLSVFVAPPMRFVLWGIGLLIDLLTPVFTLRLQAQLPRFSTNKLPERFGLFVIIVLGESVLGIVSGLAERPYLTWTSAMIGVLAIAIVFGMWWIYFDFVNRRVPKRGTKWAFSWGYLHLPLVIAVTATGAGILNVVSDKDLQLDPGLSLLIGGMVGLSLMVMGLLELTLERLPDEPTHPILSPGLKLGAGLLAIAFGGISGGLSVIWLQLALLALLGVQVAYGMYAWFTQEMPIMEPNGFEMEASLESDESPS